MGFPAIFVVVPKYQQFWSVSAQLPDTLVTLLSQHHVHGAADVVSSIHCIVYLYEGSIFVIAILVPRQLHRSLEALAADVAVLRPDVVTLLSFTSQM